MAASDNERSCDDIMKSSSSFPLGLIGSTLGALETLVENGIRATEGVMYGKIETYDRKTHTALVKPMVKILGTNGEELERCAIPCTVLRCYSGNFLIDMPLDKDDTGWIIAADRDTTAAKQSNEPENPTTLEMKKFRFGFFIPDKAYGDFDLHPDDIDNQRMVIQTKDGSQRISLGYSDIKIYGGKITIQGDEVEIKANSTIKMDAPNIKTNGKEKVAGGCTGVISGAVTATVVDGIVTGIGEMD